MKRLNGKANGRSIDIIKRCVSTYLDNNMSVFAGYATLLIVAALFPFLMLTISIINLLPGYSADDVAGILLQMLPDIDILRELIYSIVSSLKEQSGGLLASAAAVTTFWSAGKGVSAIQKGLDQLDGSEKEKGIKGILRRLAFTLLILLLVPALLIFEVLGDSIAGTIGKAIAKIDPDKYASLGGTIDSFFNISAIIVGVISVLVIMLIFAYLPRTHRKLKSQLPGALVTSVGWLAFTELFSYFVPRFYNASKLYGSLASLFLGLLWLRFMVMILFGGGVLNKVLEEDRKSENKCETKEITEDDVVDNSGDLSYTEKVKNRRDSNER